MSEPKRYFQLVRDDEHGKVYRIVGTVRRCARCGRYIVNKRCDCKGLT